MAAAIAAAATSLDTELIEVLGAGAAALATLGLLLILPIFLTHRREVQRLLEWKERDPEAGTTEFRAVAGPVPLQPDAAPTDAPTRVGGKLSPAERVTSERPALTRISTGEYAALQPEPEPVGFWRRVIERGPRHPLVLTIAAILFGIAAFVVGSQLIRSDDERTGPGAVDPATVEVAVVNATSEPGIGNAVSDRLEAKGFVIASTTATSPGKNSGVFYGRGQRREGRAVARSLGLPAPKPFEAEQEAAADGADVVVVVGEDGAALPSGGSGGGDGKGGG